MSENSLYKRLQQNKKELSVNSLKTYSSVIKSLMKKNNISDLSEENIKSKKVESYIKGLPLKARKVVLSALLIFFTNSSKSFNNQKEEWKQLIQQDMKEDRANDEKQQLTATQKDNWMDWKDINKRREELKAKAPEPKGKWSAKEKRAYMDYLIASLYTFNTPRRAQDYAEMAMKAVKGGNYVDWKNEQFVFNNYKTAKDYGTQKIDIDPKLMEVLNVWKKYNTDPYMLYDYHGNPMNAKKLSARLGSIFQKPGFGVNILRHSFVSDKLKNVPFIDKLKEIAEELGHSSKETMLYKKRT